MNISYDSRCRDLAEVFLLDEPQLNDAQHQHELAGVIQMTIETWIACERDAHELLSCGTCPPRCGDAHSGQGKQGGTADARTVGTAPTSKTG